MKRFWGDKLEAGKKVKMAIIGSVGIPANYGGFETLVEQLTRHLSDDIDITVFCSAKSYPDKLERYNGAKLEYINLRANGWQSVFYDAISMFKSLKYDLMLILGVSGCIFLPLLRLFTKAKIIVNVDGLEWSREKWGYFAKKFLKFSERLAVYNADVVIADNEAIQDYIKKEYGVESEYIPYGGDHVQKLPLDDEILSEFPFLKYRYALTVCRIEPENNVHIILESFEDIDKLHLVIIGNWGNSKYSRKLRDRYSRYPHIHLLDAIYDQKKLDKIRSNAFVYIHGHSKGGTNPSLVEAIFLNSKIVYYDVIFNRYTTKGVGIYFKDSRSLKTVLNQVLDEDCTFDGKKDLFEFYKWYIVSCKYKKIFLKD